MPTSWCNQERQTNNNHSPATVRTDDCYYESSSSYMGHVNHTTSGLQCQRWDSQYPHSHSFDHGENFVDGVLPENYCRNILTENYEPWCYTTDPNKRWEYCSVTKCPGRFYYLDYNVYFYVGYIYIVYPGFRLNICADISKYVEHYFIYGICLNNHLYIKEKWLSRLISVVYF